MATTTEDRLTQVETKQEAMSEELLRHFATKEDLQKLKLHLILWIIGVGALPNIINVVRLFMGN